MRRPGIAAAVTGGALGVLALPLLHIHTTQSGLDALPDSAPTVQTIKKISDAFGNGETGMAAVAIKANVDSPATQQAIASLKAQVQTAHLNTSSVDVEVNPSHTAARVHIPLVGQVTASTSTAALAT